MALPEPYSPEEWPGSPSEVQGLKFDWFARDRIGQLAVFSSAGRGSIPRQTFAASVPYNDLIAAIGRRATSPAITEFAGEGCYRDWEEFAEYGLFAYDFHDLHRVQMQERAGYDLMYRPSVPATIAEVPEHVASWLPVIDTVFGTSDLIRMSLIEAVDAVE
jgi:hypothetical protein